MPPWPMSAQSGVSILKSSPQRRTATEVEGPHLADELYRGLPLHGVPILFPADSIAPTRRHRRCHSYPFLSGLESENIAAASANNRDSEYLNSLPFSYPVINKGHYMASADGPSTQTIEKDFLTGKCSTCDSLVRWPKNLGAFRCTVCLMVNDLDYSPSLPSETRTSSKTIDTTTPAQPTPTKRVLPISLGRTVNLIDECLSLYLRSRLEHTLATVPRTLPDHVNQTSTLAVSYSTSLRQRCHCMDTNPVENVPSPSRDPSPPLRTTLSDSNTSQKQTKDPSQFIFQPLERYLLSCFSNPDCMNLSFPTSRSSQPFRSASESATVESPTLPKYEDRIYPQTPCPELDGKTLLLGDFAENGMWWTGRSQLRQYRPISNPPRVLRSMPEERVNFKSPRINWTELDEWYHMVTAAGHSWPRKLQELQEGDSSLRQLRQAAVLISDRSLQQIDDDIAKARAHIHFALLNASENLLRRPGRPLKSPEECRFLLLLIMNPLLCPPAFNYPEHAPIYSNLIRSERSGRKGAIGRHWTITKRILGLLANLPTECHYYLVNWFARLPESHFRRLVDLVGRFVTYRLSKQRGRKLSNSHDPSSGLIPHIAGPGAGTPSHLHAALSNSASQKLSENEPNGQFTYSEDWQIKAAARIMSLLFSANNQVSSRPHAASMASASLRGKTQCEFTAYHCASQHGQLLPTSAFYNTLLDHSDLIADFEAWESRQGKFSFCQYPMFLSIWAKIRIMEHDARRQMETKAREAFFNSIMSRKAVNQYLDIRVRRNCLVEDSLHGVSLVVGTAQEEIKKGLRIEFIGEEGLDSGGLRKEWFLLLVREVFDPEHGLFVYDEDSHYCYFNPNTFETSDQFYLVGVVLGLAIYNSTMLDVALPPFAFRKLLASTRRYTGPVTSSYRSESSYTINDLAEFKPSLAHGLRLLLEFDGDVEETFCRDFVAEVERYGQIVRIPLCPNGQYRTVTNNNRHEFVDLYIRYLLDISVARQYDPFQRGFLAVCGSNALSLFRPEEIELLIRGSEEPLDVATLQSVAIYEGWGKGVNSATESVVEWFWQAFTDARVKEQRKLLSFITSSDRIPAMGAASLVIKIACLGDRSTRLPIARTCFNMLGLYRYSSREILKDKLWTAVVESEGFGMK